jgi:hypothetical protein
MSYAYFHIVQFEVIASFFLFFVAGIYHGFCADRLIRFEYKNYKDNWIIDGQPCGYLWKPKEFPFWLTGANGYYCTEKWLKETPEWIQNDSKATDFLNRLRLSKRLAYLSLGICGVIFIVFLLFRNADFKV